MHRTLTFLGWYVHRDGQSVGPLATAEIQSLVASGQLPLTAEVVKACKDDRDRVRYFGSQAFLALGEQPARLGNDVSSTSRIPARGVLTSGEDEAMARLQVLVVDDCQEAADSLAMVLRLWDHDARAAYGGRDALDAAAHRAPDVALVDIGMPGMDGCDLARHLRRQAGLQNTRLVAVTGFGDAVHRGQGKEAGFDDYLVKPVDLTLLQRLLDRQREEGASALRWTHPTIPALPPSPPSPTARCCRGP